MFPLIKPEKLFEKYWIRWISNQNISQNSIKENHSENAFAL